MIIRFSVQSQDIHETHIRGGYLDSANILFNDVFVVTPRLNKQGLVKKKTSQISILSSIQTINSDLPQYHALQTPWQASAALRLAG